MDYNTAFENADGLLENWNSHLQKLLNFLIEENHVKDKHIKSVLYNLKNNTPNISESKYLSYTYLLLRKIMYTGCFKTTFKDFKDM